MVMHKIILPSIFQPFECYNISRLGKEYDGGYIVSLNDVIKTKKLISFGIGTDWSFERDFLKYKDCELDAYDKSVQPNDEYNKFFSGKNKHIKQNVGKELTVSEILKREEDVFLKCDIEGDEYLLLKDIINKSHKITGMIIEFHEITKPNNFDALTNFISKVHHKLIHTHVNNYFYYKTENGNIPDILELSFSSSLLRIYNPNLKLPHNLDMPNNPHDSEFEINFIDK